MATVVYFPNTREEVELDVPAEIVGWCIIAPGDYLVFDSL